ncbi:MAG: hypothetical protein H6718_21855 [Polyangiaceae bacterium]|nr:hypothetical protein [Polyangiaceae bacterium]
MVLALALSEEQLAGCVPPTVWAALQRQELWPSQRLLCLAQWALADRVLWLCVAQQLDVCLGSGVATLDAYCPAEIVERFQLVRSSATTRELASLVWGLLKRERPALEALAERLARELEALALQRCRQRELTPA